MPTRNSITGTSVNTPTVVASAADEVVPNNAIATTTASSKKFDAPIIPAGAAILCGSFKSLQAKYAMANMRNVCKISGTAISTICSGFSRIVYLIDFHPKRLRLSRAFTTI